MNRKINIILALLLVIALLAGCSNSATTNNEPKQNNDNHQEQGNEPADQDSNEENHEDQDSEEENQEENQVIDDENDEIALEDPFRYQSDIEYSFDLNYDGQAESVIYHNDYETINMTINGKTFELENIYAELTIDLFMLTDIDATDNNLEIVINEADPPFGESLSFYRYDGENFYSIGTVGIGFLAEGQERVFIDGNGGVLAVDKSNIMEEGFYYKMFSISETGTLEETLPEDIFDYISPITSKVNKEIRGYEGKSTDESYEAIPVGEEIVINGEMGNWLNIKWNDKELWVNDDELTHFITNYPEEKFEFDGIQFWS